MREEQPFWRLLSYFWLRPIFDNLLGLRFAWKKALQEDATVTAVDPTQVVDLLSKFSGNDLTGALSRIEHSVRGLTAVGARNFLLEAHATNEVLIAAAEMKRLAGQINVVIHSFGILLCLPHILEVGEQVEKVSLGAGNTGREFDLETNYRVAEFKFIHWRAARGHPTNSISRIFFCWQRARARSVSISMCSAPNTR